MTDHMKGLLDDFEDLTNQLHDALVQMDAQRVSSVTVLQTTCLDEIQRQMILNPELREGVAERLETLQPLFERNKLLLRNAMDMTNQVIQIHMAQNHISFDYFG